MGFLDSVIGMFGTSKKSKKTNDSGIMDALKDGKIDAQDFRNIATDELDQNNDGKLDLDDARQLAQDKFSK